ncbi:hypothetical protein PVT71_28440 (plasmid) [Salipiger sp. H15]|uniref:C-type lectin domain-containing protein n=1 Tax=Alloyangia sp. H15 TaxID=3029062 RepID=A0AAU8ATU5_9RHOB
MAKQLKVVSIERVSIYSDGSQAELPSQEGIFSQDGQTLVLETRAQLVPGDDNDRMDLYLQQEGSSAWQRVTLDSPSNVPDGGMQDAAISADGNQIAFVGLYQSPLGELQSAIYYKHLLTGEEKLISASAGGVQGNNESGSPIFTPDGTKIAFNTAATNLIPGQSVSGIFLKDIASGAIQLLSSNVDGDPASGSTQELGFSPDGSKFLFISNAGNLVAGVGGGVGQVYEKDLVTGEVMLLSTAANGAAGNADCLSATYSPDGTKLLITSRATNFAPDSNEDGLDLFIKDLATGEITLISTDSVGNQHDGSYFGGRFSPDGTRILFQSTAALVPGDDNGTVDLYVKVLATGQVSLVTTNEFGVVSNGPSQLANFLPDGSGIIFSSSGSNLVPGDTNDGQDVFVARFAEFETGTPVQWTEAEGGNGHWYEYVEGPLSWDEARAEAETRSHLGLPGYLATITSAGENAFILSITPPNVWAGGSDARSEGTWEWATGPEAGEVFWTRASGALGYADWGGFEPNNAWSEPPGVDYLTVHSLYASGTWADNGIPPNPNHAFGYVVEYSALDRPPAAIGPGRTEAENLDIARGFVPERNPWASEDGLLRAQDGGEAGASGRFTGAAGLYSVVIGYFDETDGASRLRLEVNGETVDAWTWDADPAGATVTGAAAMRRVVPVVALEEGDVLTLAGCADGGEPLRTDYIDIHQAPPVSGSFVVEAETFEIIKDMQIAHNPHASGGAYLQTGGAPDPRASYSFDGAAGTYDLTVGYFDESDGASQMTVAVNGVALDSWLWDGTFGDAIVTKAGAARHTIHEVALAPGDVIEISGHPDGGEPLRTDYIAFDPVDPATGPDAFLFI